MIRFVERISSESSEIREFSFGFNAKCLAIEICVRNLK